VKRMCCSSLSLSSFTLVALAGLGFIVAGRGPTAAADSPPAGAAALAKTVTIQRDTFGVPHVYGPTDASCVFGFIYAQAEDYFWQIEDSYLRSLGRAAEVYGDKSLPDDLVNRALEITRLSKEEYKNATPKTKQICQAVADGLNYYLSVNPQVKPRVITHFEPWHPLAFRRFILYQSFIYGKSGLQAADILAAVQEIHGDKAGAVTFPAALRDEVAALERDRQSMSEHVGSNMWAIRPDKSTSGKALMFINPHQPFFGPGQWYEGHVISGEGWNLLGACFFGSPFPTLGYNGHVAWSHTVNNPDIVDLYTITFDDKTDPLKYHYGDGSKQATAWTEEVVVKGAKGPVSRRFRLTKTHQGPLVAVRDGKPLAIRLAKLEDGGAIEQSYAMGRAKSVAEFKAAMQPCNLPMFNAIVADTGGNIFYVYNGAVPRRSTKFDWTKPVDGSNPETEWQGYLRFDELPQLENPKCGFLQNCNQSPLSTTPVAKELQAGEVDENPKASQFPPYVMATETERDNPRAQISRRILHSTAKFAYDDWTRDGFDTKILEAENRIPDLVKEWEALSSKEPDRAAKVKEPVELLKDWDHISTVDSVPMTLFARTYDRVLKMRAKRDLQNYPRIRALEATLADLEKTQGSWKVSWGEVNRLQRIHGSQIDMQGQGAFRDDRPSLPIAGAPGPLGVVFNFYTRPQAGQKRQYGVAGHSFVAAVELAEQPKAKTILQFGESGDPASPHWFDQAALYAKKQFKPSWYATADVEAHSERLYHPGDQAAAEKSAAHPAGERGGEGR
jgi:acyl-homoserine-lactone acylase